MILLALLHIVLSSLIAYVLSFLNGELTTWIAIVSLLSSVVASLWLINEKSEDFLNLRISRWRKASNGILERIVFAVIFFISLRHFLFLYYESDHEMRSLHSFNLGDLPLHIHYIRNLASGVSFPPINPNFPAELLRYPFGIDLYNALWEILGVPTTGHLFLVGLFCSVISLVCLRLAGSWLAMVAFFLSGGFVSIGQGTAAEMSTFLSWKNLFLSMFITQRGFLWALPAGVLLIYFLFLNARKKNSRALSPRSLSILGILWGGLAFFHLHSFFMISLLIGIRAIAHLVVSPQKNPLPDLKKYLRLWIWPAIIGPYFILISLNFFKVKGVIHWHWGWTFSENENIFAYLASNFGTPLLLFVGVGVIIFANKRKNYYFEYLVHLLLFLLFFNLILAPWEWDNVKVLVWPFLGLSFLSFEVLRQLWTRWMQILLLVSLSYGGVYALWDSQFSIAHHIVLYKTAEVADARAAVSQIPAQAVFASGTTYNHELTALGRNRLLGYEGHLWAHGIQFQDAKLKLNEIMEGSNRWLELAHELKVNFIYWGPRERQEFNKVPNPVWRSQLANISRVIDYEVYQIPPSLPSSQDSQNP